jgi:hypothetical protein
MSSTNRSSARDAHIADYYVTPIKSITDFIEHFQSDYGVLGSLFLDPCAGGDAQNKMSYPTALAQFGYTNIETLDLRQDSLAIYPNTNYLEADLPSIMAEPDCIITNPPFNIALEIINKALNDVKDGGYVVMLLRLNFFGSKGRKPFWTNNLPMCCYVHSERMRFLNTGGTDSIEYMHCVWKKGTNFNSTELRII